MIPTYLKWLLVAAAAYGILYLIAQRTLFQPMKYPRGWWSEQGHAGAEDVWMETSGGVKLHGWWKPVPGSDLVTLFLHGNAGNVTHRGAHILEVTAAGSSILVIDYEGYGKSGGRPSETALYRDAETAYAYLTGKGYPPEQIILHGESLGTAVALHLAAGKPVGGVILEAPLTSARDVAGRILPLVGPLLVRGFDSKAVIGAIGAPLLIIHGDHDEVIPFKMGRALFEMASEPKSFWAVEGAGHNNIIEAAGLAYRKRLRQFYDSLEHGRTS